MLGRDGRSGAVDVAVAGLAVEVIAVEAAGLPAVGAVDSVFPAEEEGVVSMTVWMGRWTALGWVAITIRI